MYDLIIRNGELIDGSGAARVRGDIAVSGDTIVEVGKVAGPARRVIDAEGFVVTPGFIDGHTHMDAQILWDPLGTCSCWHGVTTVVMGNCGFTLAPSRPDARGLTISSLERSEELQPSTIQAGVQWRWESFADYLDVVDDLPKGINYAVYIGHSALRTWAMGERGFDSACTEADLALMKRELRSALAAGAIGLSTSRNVGHETTDDRPVASRLADWEEVRELVREVGGFKNRIFEIALEPAAQSMDSEVRQEFLTRLSALAIETGVPTTFGILARPTDQTYGFDLLKLIEQCNRDGGRMFGQSHSRGMQVLLSFQSKLPYDSLPQWAALRAEPMSAQLSKLADPIVRRALIDEANHSDYGRRLGTEAPRPDYEAMRVFMDPIGPNQSVAEAARGRGIDPVELIIDLAVKTQLKQLFMQPITATDPKTLFPILSHPEAVMTFSDSGAHVESIMDCSIQSHLLAYWVRERGQLSLEKAISMITHDPARAWNFQDRGKLGEGFRADINLLDPDTVGPQLPEIVSDLPGGGRRVLQKANGILSTIVGGEVLFESGEHTGATPGRLIRA